MGASDIAKVIVITCIATYPYYGIVKSLSRLNTNSMETCNSGCVFIRYISDHDLPSTKIQHMQPAEAAKSRNSSGHSSQVASGWDLVPRFAFLQNGQAMASASLMDSLTWKSWPFYIHYSVGAGAGLLGVGFWGWFAHDGSSSSHYQFLSPVCPGADAIQSCEWREKRELIDNHLGTSKSLIAYMVALAGWVIMKISHDIALIENQPESLTLGLGIWSVGFQAVACVSCFFWCLGVAEVFLAKDPENDCACYYQLPTLRMLLAVGTPFFLLYKTLSKMSAVALAIQFGDYLYFTTYTIPHRYVSASSETGRLTPTMVIPIVQGDVVGGVPARNISFCDFDRIGRVHSRICSAFMWVFAWVLTPLVIAPLFLRAFISSLSSTSGTVNSTRILFTLMSVGELGCIAFILKKHRVPKIANTRGDNRIIFIALKVVDLVIRIVACSLAPVVLLPAMARLGSNVSSLDIIGSAWTWSVAGVYMLFVLWDVYYFEIYNPAFKSLQIRMLWGNNDTWGDFSDKHPEYHLSKHVAFAAKYGTNGAADLMKQEDRKYCDIPDVDTLSPDVDVGTPRLNRFGSSFTRRAQSSLLACGGLPSTPSELTESE